MRVTEMAFLRDHWYPVAEAAAVAGPIDVRLFGDGFVLRPEADGGFSLVGADPAARTFPTAVRYQMVWACVGDRPTAGPPAWREAEDHPDWRFHVEFFERWKVSAPRIIDNNLDASHVAYVHRATFGDPDDARLPPIGLEPNGSGGFVSRMAVEQKGVGVQNGATADEAHRFQRVTETELLAPLVTRTRHYYGGAAADYGFFGAATPVDDEHSLYLRLTVLAGAESVQPWAAFHAFGTRVKEEDRIVLESTVPDFPVDVTSEVHLRADKVTLEYRRYLMGQLAASGAR